MMKCNTQPCNSNLLPKWVSFSTCSKSCGTGFQTLKYTDPACNSGKPDNNGVIKTKSGIPCFKNEKCNVDPCPALSQWSQWTSCLGYGSHGIQKRTRKCNGQDCTQSVYQTKSCIIPKTSCPQATCSKLSAPTGGIIKCSAANSSNSLCRLSCMQ